MPAWRRVAGLDPLTGEPDPYSNSLIEDWVHVGSQSMSGG